ncbi:hypothetical protein C8J57DRAFT_296712 [Mycena rebaudengoi]|nr:hypothetical protein C8J57DRAFT_296712 [Mycena rebaudengoi]
MSVPPPYQLRKVFFIPLSVGILVSSCAMCWDWWSGDIGQFLLLAVHFLLFVPNAYNLQLRAVQPRNAHAFMLMPHILSAGIVVFINRVRAHGFDDMVYRLKDPVTGKVTLWSYLCYVMWLPMLLRAAVAIWGTTWTYISCIILSEKRDILTRKGASHTYNTISHYMYATGYGLFVALVKPAPFPERFPVTADFGDTTISV